MDKIPVDSQDSIQPYTSQIQTSNQDETLANPGHGDEQSTTDDNLCQSGKRFAEQNQEEAQDISVEDVQNLEQNKHDAQRVHDVQYEHGHEHNLDHNHEHDHNKSQSPLPPDSDLNSLSSSSDKDTDDSSTDTDSEPDVCLFEALGFGKMPKKKARNCR